MSQSEIQAPLLPIVPFLQLFANHPQVLVAQNMRLISIHLMPHKSQLYQPPLLPSFLPILTIFLTTSILATTLSILLIHHQMHSSLQQDFIICLPKNLQSEACQKEMKLNEAKELDLFLKHLESFAAPEVCCNLQGGGHCKCNCLHVLWDVNIWTAVAKWCVQFSQLKKLNKTRFSWIGSITQDLQIQQRTKCWRLSWFPIILMRWTLKPFSHSRRLSALLQLWQSVVLEIGDGHWSSASQWSLQLPSKMAIQTTILPRYWKMIQSSGIVPSTSRKWRIWQKLFQ